MGKLRIGNVSMCMMAVAVVAVVLAPSVGFAAENAQRDGGMQVGTPAVDLQGADAGTSAGEASTFSKLETAAADESAESQTPTGTSNVWAHEYSRAASTTKCHLHVNGSSLERVEFSGSELIVESIAKDFKTAISKKTIAVSTYNPSNLASGNDCLWGGFFSGASHNYVVTGQSNDPQDDDRVVFRVTKYTKDWSYVAAAELRGANTTLPFRAGSCSMAEQDGKLYVRTCHQMYTSSDGLRHQANVHIAIDESTMNIESSFTGVMNIGIASGYVSHSFNQFLTTLGGNVYGFDHGDAYPRSAVVKQLGGGYADVISFPGEIGDNATGATIGGLESSSTNNTLLTVGTWTYDQALSGSPSNVWVGVTSGDLSTTSVKYLTSYSGESVETAGNPFLVKVSDDRFLVMWGVASFPSGAHQGIVRYQFIDGNGNGIGAVKTVSAVLSDCKPALHDGKLTWYAGDGGTPSFYSIDAASGAFSKVELLSSATVDYEGSQYLWYDWRTDDYTRALPYSQAQTCPETTVSLGGRVLKEGEDYGLSYEVDEAKSQGVITATGLNSYAGSSKSVTFDIISYQLGSWDVSVAPSQTYSGKELCPEPSVVVNGKTLKAGKNYDVSYKNNVNAGTATLTVAGKGIYGGEVSRTFTIDKCANTLKVSLVEKVQTARHGKRVVLKSGKVFKVVKNVSKGKVTYKKLSGSSKVSVSSGGQVVVSKGVKNATYTVKASVSSKETSNYKAASKMFTLKVKIK